MAITTHSATLRWPRPQDLQPAKLHPYYDRDLDLLVLSFTSDPVPRVEVPLQSHADSTSTPLASVRLDVQNKPTRDVIGVMVENLSDNLTLHPSWRMLTEGRIDRDVLASLIATFSPLPEETDEPEV